MGETACQEVGFAEPAGHRTAAPAHLQAASPGGKLEPLDPAYRDRVEAFLEKLQPTALVGPGVRKRVTLGSVGHVPHPMARGAGHVI